MSKKIIPQSREYQICASCVMDTSDPDITFDENGVCMRCNEYKNRILPEWNHGQGHEKELQDLIAAIKESGKNNKYDCILGLSGGLDSSYMLHLAVKEWGLRPFVFHIDAGWSPNGKTKELIPGLVGWIKACGYDCEVKPDAFVASTIADKISK